MINYYKMSDAVYPNTLNFSPYIDSIGNPKERISQAPFTASNVTMGTGHYEFEIAGQQANAFADFRNAFIALDVTNNDASGVNISFPSHLGSYAMINRLIIETSSGKKITEIDNFNALMSLKNDEMYDNTWLASREIMIGCKDDLHTGVLFLSSNTPAQSGVRHVIIPLACSVFTESDNLIPLCGIEAIRVKIYFEQAITAFISSDGGVANSDVALSSPLLWYDRIELSDGEMNNLLKLYNNVLSITGNDYQNQIGTYTATDTKPSFTLGFSKRKAKKLYGMCRETALLTSTTNSVNSFSRTDGDITDIALYYNGSKINKASLSVNTQPCEVMAEILKSRSHNIMSSHASAIDATSFNTTDPTSVSSTTMGQFFFILDLTNGLQLENNKVIDGLNVQTGNFTLVLTKAASAAGNVDLFLEYENSCTLNMAGSKAWVIEY